MIYYQKGSTQTVVRTKTTIKYLLLNYLGEFRNSNRVATFKLKTPLPDGRDQCIFEVWECQNLNTGLKEIKKLPVYSYSESPEETLEQDRLVTINDIHEVTSLLDGYNCWLDYCTLSVPAECKRDGKNFHLSIINNRHFKQIQKLKDLDSDNTLDPNYRVGIRLKLIHKENPNHLARRDFNIWKKEFPAFFTKLQEYVYTTSSNFNTISANQ